MHEPALTNEAASKSAEPWWEACLTCPRDGEPVQLVSEAAVCSNGHRYPIVEGIPIMLVEEDEQTLWVAKASLEAGKRANQGTTDPYCIETLGVSDSERALVRQLLREGCAVDPVVAVMVAATNGILYRQLIGKVSSLPIPELRLPPGNGARLLDVGCNWGRWSIAASRLGYDVVGIDPSIGALLAAQRVSRSLGLSPRFVCGDARRLPFRANTFDVAFSYSVIQHFSFEDAHKTLASIRKCTRDGGTVLIQMPNKVGIRCLYHQARRLFEPGQGFDVRYWSTGELLKAFSEAFGESQLEVDCFFGLGLQPSDHKIMSRGASALIDASEALRSLSMQAPLLTELADSVYVRSRVDPRA